MKIEVGKKYELNNGEVHECTHMRDDDPMHVDCYGYGPFVINYILYHQDGRFADADADHEYSVKREVLTVQVGKYYRTRDGRKVGPIGYNPNITNYGKFFSGGTFWDEFGRLYQATKETDRDLIAEWTEDGTGTLAELDVKPGDVVTPMLQCASDDASLTIGNAYEIMIDPNDGDASLIDDDGDWCDLTGSSIFRIISSASDTPKTWGEMTDAEKGELLLALHEGKVIEWRGANDWNWVTCESRLGSHGFGQYRIKPEPVRETVTLYGVNGYQGDIEFESGRDFGDWRITFTTTDGKPDLDSIKMEALG